jgi:hypothetical protein
MTPLPQAPDKGYSGTEKKAKDLRVSPEGCTPREGFLDKNPKKKNNTGFVEIVTSHVP